MEMIARLGADTSGFTSAMSRVSSTMGDIGNQARNLGDRMSSSLDGKNIKAFGDGMQNAGKKMTLLTAPLAAFGIGAIKVGADFQQSMANVSAISGATGSDFLALENKAREMGATTKFSASEAADALSFMGMAGWDTQQMLDGIPGVMNLAAASGADLALTSDILTDAISAFGDKASDAGRYADVMAAASSAANTNVEMLGESFKYVAPVAGALGYSLEDTSKALALMANNGIKASQGGTSLKNILTNMANPTKKMKGAMDDLGLSLTNSDGSMKSLDEVMGDLRQGFAGLSEEQKAQYAASLAGKEGMAGLLAIVGASESDFNKLGDAINNSNGKAQQMADVMGDTVQGKMLAMKSALEEVGIVIFKALEPALYAVIDAVTDLAKWFQGLSPSMQSAIVALAGIAVAIGPVLMIMGTLISAVGSIITVVGAVSGAFTVMGTGVAAATPLIGGLATVFTVLTGPIGLAIAAIAGIGIGVGLLVNHLSKDAIPEIDRFGKGISETTQAALGSFFELSDGVGEAMADLTINTSEVTEEIAGDMIGKFSAMNEQVLAGMNERHAKQIESMTSFFENSSVLTDEQEKSIIKQQEWSNEMQIATQEQREARVKEILETASQEKRKLTENEEIEINAIRTSMNDTAVKELSANEVEQKIIMERMKQTAGDLSAKQAADVVKKSAEQRDGAIAAAEEQYEGTIAEIIRMRDETGVISEDQATKLIAEATKTKDTNIKHAKDLHKGVVDEAKKQAEGHVNHVDWETGEIKSKWAVMKTNISTKMSEIGNDIKTGWNLAWTLTKMFFTNMYNDASTIFSSIKTVISSRIEEAKTQATEKIRGMAVSLAGSFLEVANNARNKFDEVRNRIVTPIESARDKVKAAIDAVKGFFSNLKLTFPKITMPKLPKFSLTGSFSLMPPSVPKVSVNWNAKGGIFNKPTIFNTSAGLQGVGEAGSEAIIPLNQRVLGGIGQGIASTMSNGNSGNHPIPAGGETYNFTFNVENMNANSSKDVDNFASLIQNNLRRNKGVK